MRVFSSVYFLLFNKLLQAPAISNKTPCVGLTHVYIYTTYIFLRPFRTRSFLNIIPQRITSYTWNFIQTSEIQIDKTPQHMWHFPTYTYLHVYMYVYMHIIIVCVIITRVWLQGSECFRNIHKKTLNSPENSEK